CDIQGKMGFKSLCLKSLYRFFQCEKLFRLLVSRIGIFNNPAIKNNPKNPRTEMTILCKDIIRQLFRLEFKNDLETERMTVVYNIVQIFSLKKMISRQHNY